MFSARGVRQALRRCRRKLEYRFVEIAAKSPHTARWYYAIKGEFAFEAWRVLNGVLAHRHDPRTPGKTDLDGRPRTDARRYALRRGTHRLEKGLSMRPRRSAFGLDYIDETIQALSEVAGEVGNDGRGGESARELLQWACDVLANYFDACGDNPKLEEPRRRFHLVCESLGWRSCNRVPHARGSCGTLPSYDTLLALAKRRRSVRWFEDRRVPRELVDRALEIGLLSPSACNRQPFRFVFLDDRALIDTVGTVPMGTAGFLHNIPMLGVAIGQLRAFAFERDRHLIYIDTALAVMAFEFALEAQGLSSCSINWPAIETKEQQISRALRLAPDETPIMLLAIGYPDETGFVAYSAKKPLGEARSYNLE